MKIAEVKKIYNIAPSTLRYYEREGLIPNVRRIDNGIRDYSESDCKIIEQIIWLKRLNVPISILKKYIELYRQEGTLQERKEILNEHYESLEYLYHNLENKMLELKLRIDNLDNNENYFKSNMMRKMCNKTVDLIEKT